MPVLDGWETCQRIRSLKLISPLTLILMSQLYDNNQITQLQNDKLGTVDGYLLKPVTPSSLFDSAANIHFSMTSKKGLESPASASQVLGRLKEFRILLVEDNLTNQVVAHDLLVSEGAHVTISGSPMLTLDIIEKGSPLFDVVLMDIQMPGMDGYTLTKKIRQKYSRRRLPIIAVSANTFEDSRDKTIQAGMNAFVCKPFRLDELVTTILQVTRPRVARINAQDLDEKEALNRLGGNREIYTHSLGYFIDDVKKLLNALPSSLVESESEQLNRTLHTLKGLAATMSANALLTMTNEVYQKVKEGSLGNKDWLKYHRKLNRIGLEAIANAQRVLKKSVSEHQEPLKLTNQQHLLKKLIPYLEANNMKALALYTELKQKIGIDKELDTAMERLDFNTAAIRCKRLMKHNSKGAI